MITALSKKEILATNKAPQAIGPYSQGVVCGCGYFLFTSGQIPLDPVTGKIVGPDIKTQARQVLENLKAILEATGSSLKAVVKTTVYLADMANFSAMNEVYQEYFKDNPPARSTVQVSKLPKDALVEIEAIAIL